MSTEQSPHIETNGCVTVNSPDRIERSDAVPMLSNDPDLPEHDAIDSLTITRKYVPVIRMEKPKECGNRKRTVVVILGSMFIFISLVFLVTGTIRLHQCQPQSFEFPIDDRYLDVHFGDIVRLNNYALEKPVNQTSMSSDKGDGPPYMAVDGDINTCARTDKEISPRLEIDLKHHRPIGFILLHGSEKQVLHDITIYIYEEEVASNTSNFIKHNRCYQQEAGMKSSKIVTDCGRALNGRYIVIEMNHAITALDNLMVCEVVVIQR